MALERLTPRQPSLVIAMSTLIPVERLWELYDYNFLTGKLISKATNKPVKGFPNRAGYIRMTIWCEGRPIQRSYHQTVYAWCVGHWAIHQLDHINRDKSDNRIQNLRDVTSRENRKNTESFNGGATWNKEFKHWRAQILLPGQKHQTYLGAFNTKAEAQAAYARAASELP